MGTVRSAQWGRSKFRDDNEYCKEVAQGWVASGGFAQASVRACVYA